MGVTQFRVIKKKPFKAGGPVGSHYVLAYKTNVYSVNTLTFEDDESIILTEETVADVDFLNIEGKFIAEPEEYVVEETGVVRTGWALKSPRVTTFG